MRFISHLAALTAALLLVATATPTFALNVVWGEWVNAEGLYGANIDRPGGTVTAIYGGAANGLTSGPCLAPGSDFWATGNYNGPANKPVCDRLLLSQGGEKTITFSEPLENPYLAVMNWDSVAVLFDEPFELISSGAGLFGEGTPIINGDSTGFSGDGPVHAILRFNGTFSSISFIDSTTGSVRYLTVGAGDGAAIVPEPASWATMIAGFGIVGLAVRRRRSWMIGQLA